MTINITTASLISEIKQKSHYDSENFIKEAEARYKVEAGTEKADEINSCVLSADSQLRTLVTRYLVTTPVDPVTVGITPPVTLTYALGLSERRDANKCAQLPQLFRDYLASAALSKFYATMSVTDLASKWGNQAAALGADIVRILFHKNPPTL